MPMHALFFILPFDELDKAPKEDIKIPRGVQKIFHYFNMYICILEDNDLQKKSFTLEEALAALAGMDLPPEEGKFLEGLTGDLIEATDPSKKDISRALVSRVKTHKIIKPIIQSIVSQLPDDFTFRWMITELNEITLPEPPLTKNSEGAGGGGNG